MLCCESNCEGGGDNVGGDHVCVYGGDICGGDGLLEKNHLNH